MSDERRAEGLSASEWQAVLAAVREGVVVHDASGAIISANEAACRILGLTIDQLKGLDPLDPRWQAARPDGSPLPGEEHPAMVTLRTGLAVDDEVMEVALPGGARRFLRVSARPLASTTGDGRVVATFVDITEERERELQYRALSESTDDLVAHVVDGTVRYASPAALRTLGRIDGLVARDVAARSTHPDDLATFLTAMDQIGDGRPSSEVVDLRVRDMAGDWHWLDMRVWQADGVPGRVVVARDITARKSMERELADAEALFRQAFEEAPIGMAMTSAGAVDVPIVVLANQRYADALGRPLGEIVGHSARRFTHPDDHEASSAARARLLSGESTHERMHIRVLRDDGTTPWHVLTRTLLRDQAGAPRYVLAQLEDAGAAQDMVSKLAVLAHTDPLTGLANRRGLDTELAAVLADPYAMAHTAVFFLDLEGFKAVNDRFGHVVGDEVLRRVGGRLAQLTRSHDTVARVGGDEFVVIARHVSTHADAALVADRLTGALLPVDDALPLEIRASVGSARPVPGDTAATLVDRADRDMYRHKRRTGP